ncbi:MAG: preprotein translocase subunit SecG [Alphaproteobacteria bacterium]|nr:preprotein translocase subunit SecG [Alphaproteobacteria bacterium]
MIAIILTLHSLIVLALIVLVLLQRSDGGALGIGGGGGGLMSGRAAANTLTRLTSILAAGFFATSLGLAVMAGGGESDETVIEELTGQAAPAPSAVPGETTTQDLLGTLGSDSADETPAGPSIEDALEAVGADAPEEAGDAPAETSTEEPAESDPNG